MIVSVVDLSASRNKKAPPMTLTIRKGDGVNNANRHPSPFGESGTGVKREKNVFFRRLFGLSYERRFLDRKDHLCHRST
jgi:hypothetical protein